MTFECGKRDATETSGEGDLSRPIGADLPERPDGISHGCLRIGPVRFRCWRDHVG